MLRFANRPDEIFLLLLNEAIEDMICFVEMDDDVDEQQDALRASMPRSSRLFTAARAVDQLRVLRDALNSSVLYRPTDYHWLVLYECLRSYCDYFNDERIGDLYELHKIEVIDFGSLTEHYFWDTDFLNDDSPNLSFEVRQMMGVSSETFGLTAGMKPHPDELVLAVCGPDSVKELERQPLKLFIPGSKEYPALPDHQG